MRLLVFFIGCILAMATSCITQQKCNERFPPVSTFTSDTSTSFKDSLAHLSLIQPPKSIELRDTIHDTIHDGKYPCPDYHKEQEKDGLKQTINIHNGVVTATCAEADSLRIEKDLLIKQKQLLIKQLQTKSEPPITVTTNILKWWQEALMVGGGFFLFALLFVLVALFFKIVK